MSVIAREKKKVKLRAGGLESVYILVKGRVRFKWSLFQSFLHAFPQGLALVCSGEVSVIVRGTQGESKLLTNPNLALFHFLL